MASTEFYAENFFLGVLFFTIFMLDYGECFDSEFCLDKTDGYHEDATDCASYYHCTFGSTFHYTCPVGTTWDQLLVNCNYAATTCAPQIEHAPPPPSSGNDNSRFISNHYTVTKNKQHLQTPIETTQTKSIINCANICTSRGPQNCLSFNFIKNSALPASICELYDVKPNIETLGDNAQSRFGVAD